MASGAYCFKMGITILLKAASYSSSPTDSSRSQTEFGFFSGKFQQMLTLKPKPSPSPQCRLLDWRDMGEELAIIKAMQRDVKNILSFIEDMLRPLTVVSVPVDDGDPLESSVLDGELCGDGDVVEEGESVRLSLQSAVVAGGANYCEGVVVGVIGESSGCQEDGPDCGYCCGECVFHVVGVSVDVHLAFLVAIVPHVLHELEVALPVDCGDQGLHLRRGNVLHAERLYQLLLFEDGGVGQGIEDSWDTEGEFWVFAGRVVQLALRVVDDKHFALRFFIPAFLNPLLLHYFAEIRIMAAGRPKYLLSYHHTIKPSLTQQSISSRQ